MTNPAKNLFEIGEICFAWYFDPYGKVELYYAKIHSIGDEYADCTLYTGGEWTGDNGVYGRYKDVCLADLIKNL